MINWILEEKISLLLHCFIFSTDKDEVFCRLHALNLMHLTVIIFSKDILSSPHIYACSFQRIIFIKILKNLFFFYIKEILRAPVPFHLFYAEKQIFISHKHGQVTALNWWTIAQSQKPCGKTITWNRLAAVSLLLSYLH